MQIALITAGLATVLFLCAFLDIRQKYEALQKINIRAQEEHSEQCAQLQEKLGEAQKTLFDYMDVTRKEALDSYRRGLQDGILTAEQKAVYGPKNPVKTLDEHLLEKQRATTPQEPPPETFIDSLLKGHANMMAFTGDNPTEKE